MTIRLDVDICVIGGGSGGLSVAYTASQMGASTALVEKAKMGGDCLNYGCVPSKALLAAAHAADAARRAGRLGVDVDEPRIDFARVQDHVRGVIDGIAPHDSVERYRDLGVEVIEGHARFTGPRQIEVGDRVVTARRFVIATGSSPLVPPIPGLDRVAFETNETIFERREAPGHLIVIGGGPIGVELAQAHRQLGARVTIVEMASILARDDRELTEIVKSRLRDDGIEIREGATVTGVEGRGGAVTARIRGEGGEETLEGTHLLVAAGRRPNIDDLGLAAAGIEATPRGITVDARLRTSNRRVFAIGDVAGPYQFTHMASFHAGIVIRNALFRLPAKADHCAVPWVTYTSPELAQVGMTEDEARRALVDIQVLRFPIAENDRARAERETDGLAKVITTKKGVVVGAGIAHAHAGELIQSWLLPIARGMHIKHVAGLIVPYPTLGEINKRVAGSYFTSSLFGARVKCLVRLLAKFG